MPRVNGISAWQKAEQEKERKANEEDSEISRISEAILTKLNEYRGRANMTKSEFAEFIGVNQSTYNEWNIKGAHRSQFLVLMRAAVRCGVQINVS
jgi:DNA-binding XRE family transcriptional regulator